MIQNNRKQHIGILVVIFIIIVIALLFRACGNDKNVYRNTITDSSYDFSGNRNFIAAKDSESVKMIAVRGINVNSETGETDFKIQNPKDNKYLLVAKVFLGDGTLLFKSDKVSPGRVVNNVVFPSNMDSGTYKDAITVFEYYTDKDSKLITRCEFQIEINCFGGK